MNLIRSINKYYGSHVDRVSIMVETAAQGSVTPNSQSNFLFKFRANRKICCFLVSNVQIQTYDAVFENS